MATFWKDTKNKYGVSTYQETKNSYDWIIKALQKGNLNINDMKAEFLFKTSGILCSCKGISEFTENAYGHSDFKLNHYHITIWPTKTDMIHIDVKHDNRISVSTESRGMLEVVINLLESTTLDESEFDKPISVIQLETKGDSQIKQFCTGILQNVASNFIWYLLTFIAGVLLTKMGAN